MTVGNIATLRPIFHSFFERTIRRTGYSGSRSRSGGVSRLASGYELSQHGGKSGDHGHGGPGGYMNTVTEITRGSHVNVGNGTGTGTGDESELSDGDSQKGIFAVKGKGGGEQRGRGHGNADIMVSRQVDVTYER
jgi:hypothetical protein